MTLVKNIVTDYACPVDGTTDSRPAFLAFKADAQGQNAILTIPAHTYTLPGNLWFYGNQSPFISGSTTVGDPGVVEIEYIMDQEFSPLVSKGKNRWRSR